MSVDRKAADWFENSLNCNEANLRVQEAWRSALEGGSSLFPALEGASDDLAAQLRSCGVEHDNRFCTREFVSIFM